MCGSSIAYFGLPPIFRVCMDTFGWQGTLLMVGGLFLQAIVCGVIMRPVQRQETHMAPQQTINTISKRKTNVASISTHVFVAIVMYSIGDLCTEIGYRVYLIYTAMRCDMLGLTKAETAWLYTTFGIVGMPTRPLVGLIGDRPEVNRTYMFGISAALSGIMILVTTAMKTFHLLIASSVFFCLSSGNFLFPYFTH